MSEPRIDDELLDAMVTCLSPTIDSWLANYGDEISLDNRMVIRRAQEEMRTLDPDEVAAALGRLVEVARRVFEERS